jgi:hypothetical protein
VKCSFIGSCGGGAQNNQELSTRADVFRAGKGAHLFSSLRLVVSSIPVTEAGLRTQVKILRASSVEKMPQKIGLAQLKKWIAKCESTK